MSTDIPGKVQARHLKRQAYLYIRQSSLRQVLEHTESTERQYALRQRALALGWSAEQIVVHAYPVNSGSPYGWRYRYLSVWLDLREYVYG